MNRWKSYRRMLVSDFKINKTVYILAIPMIVYYLVFHYFPMYGNIIAFKDYIPSKGILGSPWTTLGGFYHFVNYFKSYYFWQLIRNTLMINIYGLIFAFPIPIIFALLLNELRNNYFKRTVQTVVYMPHFISIVVVCGLVKEFCTTDGLLNDIIALLGGERRNLLMHPEYFRTIYVGSEIWQKFGWNSIIYLAALTGVSQELYDASIIDGANRWKQTLHVTLPCITPTIIIMLILKLGGMFTIGFEKIILLYNPLNYETSDVISSFVYRRGVLDANYSYAAAVGLINSILNFIILALANKLCLKVSDTSLF